MDQKSDTGIILKINDLKKSFGSLDVLKNVNL